MIGGRSSSGMRCAFPLVLALLLVAGSELAAQALDGSQYTCWSLPDVLRDLQIRGLPVVFSSNVVREEMQVTTPLRSEEPRRLLARLLHPHGLTAVEGTGGRLLVIQDLQQLSSGRSGAAWAPSPPGVLLVQALPVQSQEIPGVPVSALPAWIDRGLGTMSTVLVEHTVAGDGSDSGRLPALTAETRFLILQLAPDEVTSWQEVAYTVKTISVAARARSKVLAVALEASGEATRRLLEHDLAPYIDAYVLSHPAPAPAADPSGRWWWRTADSGETVLHTLLRGAALGAELVLLDGYCLDPDHRAFLGIIQAMLTVDLEPQPLISGIAADRARFLYDPHTGSYYLALYTEPGRTYQLGFSLASDLDLETSNLSPEHASFSHTRLGRRHELVLGSEHRYYLFELAGLPEHSNGHRLQVNGRRPVDPYEEVVRNQVFRAGQASRVHSLDVMERRHAVRQGSAARQYTWVHRIIERRGHLTEYHHLGVLINGVAIPEGKLRIGRDFLAEASIELEPLEIELDRTYRYELLGEEMLDGHATWKIAFDPLLPGAYLSGIVWLDQRTGARRKIRAAHTGLRGPLISREVTRFYEWINDGDQCFWSWTSSSGLSVAGSGGSWAIDTERDQFRFNRADIEEEVARAYASDTPIHVAVPPDGHRWLIKKRNQQQRQQERGGRGDGSAAGGAQQPDAGPQQQYRLALDSDPRTGSGEEPWGGRVLAGPGKNASVLEVFLRLQDNCTNDLACQDAGFYFHHQDFLSRGAELYAAVYRRSFSANLLYPRLLGSDWMLNGWVIASKDWDEQVSAQRSQAAAGSPTTSLRMATRGAGVGVLRPLGRHLNLSGSYSVRGLDFSRSGNTDPTFSIPTSTTEHRGSFGLDLRSRRLQVRARLSASRRSSWQPWGWPAAGDEPAERQPEATETASYSEPVIDRYRFGWIGAGFSTRLSGYQSIGAQVRVQKGWHLDHFSSFWAGSDSMLRVAGFQPRSFQEGIGAVLSYSRNLSSRVPVTFSLEASALRGENASPDDVDRLGIAVESILSGPYKTDIFLRIGYGLYSSLPGEAGKVRSNLVLSRRF